MNDDIDDFAGRLFNSDTFTVVNMPLLIVTGPADGVTADRIVFVTPRNANDAAMLVPIFTDDDHARTYIESLGAKGKDRNPWRPESTEKLDTILTELQAKGITHVGFDPVPPERASIYAIGVVLDKLRNMRRI